MNRKMERPVFIRDSDPLQEGSTLVVGIDRKGNIIRFNNTLEHLTGSSKKDVLDVPFSTYFSRQIPEEDLIKLIHQARFNPESVDVDTTFKTINGENVVVSWMGFAIKNEENGQVSQLNLVGTPQKNRLLSKLNKTNQKTKKQPLKKSTQQNNENKDQDKNNIKNKNDQIDSKDDTDNKNNFQDKSSIEENKHMDKTEEKSEKPSSKTIQSKKSSVGESDNKKNSKKKIKLKKRTKKPKEKSEKPEDQIVHKSKTVVSEELKDDVGENNESETHLSKNIKEPFYKFGLNKDTKEKSKVFSKFSSLKKSTSSNKLKDKSNEENEEMTLPTLQKRIKKLEKENIKLLEEKNKIEERVHSAELKKDEIKTFINTKFSFIRNSIAIKKKRQEFMEMMQQLSERKEKLEKLETEMVLEKKEFKQKIEEFITWREKLEKLEGEIEKRRQFLSEQETFLNQQYDKVLSHELEQPALYKQEIEQRNSEEDINEGIVEKDDLFNSLTVEAAVLQRGRIKKANKRFAQMLGYSEKELVGKHLVDFVGPSGLSGVEQHYMNRLKGVDDASYATVFLSKNENEIQVNVHVKNGDFQGERAEIATFNEI